MPDTPLTDILKDFRSYRPGNHREFLEWVGERAREVGINEYALKNRASASKENNHHKATHVSDVLYSLVLTSTQPDT